jgi:hypothetical protein
MATSRLEVEALANALFPDLGDGVVISLLDQYGAEAHERERDRVQLAILRMSNGDVDKLLTYIAAAKEDYRDVLMWDEMPKPTPEQVESDRRLAGQILRVLGDE